MNRTIKLTKILGLMLSFSGASSWAWGSSSQPTNNNSNVNSITNNITVNTDVTTEVAHMVYTQISENVREVKEQFKKAYDAVATVTKGYIGRFTRGKVLFGTLLGGYLSGVGMNYYLRVYLSHPLRWAHWNEHISLEQLFAIPQDKLGLELVKELQRRYTNIANPVDFITPFIMFMHDVEQERRALELFKRLGTIEGKLYLRRLMFYDQEMYEQCDKWLERVAYLNATFLHWMADFKFLQNARTLNIFLNNHWQCQRVLRLRTAIIKGDYQRLMC